MPKNEWLTCIDPSLMLQFLHRKASDRKLRLFAIACAQRIWQLFTDERSRHGIEIAERRVEGQASEDDAISAWGAAHKVVMEIEGGAPNDLAASSASSFAVAYTAYAASGGDNAEMASKSAAESVAFRSGAYGVKAWDVAYGNERRTQCDILRDLFGTIHGPVLIPGELLSWNGGEIRELAQTIYDNRSFDKMPRLADALEKAGCQATEIISHSRNVSTHWRGCWVLDTILQKEECGHALTSQQAWQSCNDSVPLLAMLENRASARQWQLFAIACCRRIWHLMTDHRSRSAVEIAERLVSGDVTLEELRLATEDAEAACKEAKDVEYRTEAEENFCRTERYSRALSELYATCVAREALSLSQEHPKKHHGSRVAICARIAVDDAATVSALARGAKVHARETFAVGEQASDVENSHQAALLRDVCGNLLGPVTSTSVWLPWNDGRERWALLPSPVTIPQLSLWLSWNDRAVPKLARTIYDRNDFHRLSSLGDVLEEAGCTEQIILEHCRNPGAHVRGCWVLELCLGENQQ